PLQQRADRVLGIGVADRVVGAEGIRASEPRAAEVAVVRVDVHAPAELAREGLAVRQRKPALRRLADVAHDQGAAKRMILDEAEAGAVDRGGRLLDQAYVLAFVPGDAPAVLVRPREPAVPRELLEREPDVRRMTGRHGEELAHRTPRLGAPPQETGHVVHE